MLLWVALVWAEDLKVTSNVHNGIVYVNGVDVGVRTPGTVYGVEPGRNSIRVVQGCYVGTADVDVVRGGTSSANVVAALRDGTLAVYPQPYEARVTVDDAAVSGPAGIPQRLACGEHTVIVAAPGYAPETVVAEVGPGEQAIVPVTLRKLARGSIELAVSPATATILLDGRPVGTNSVLLPSVTEGEHTVGAELKGKKSALEHVIVKPDVELAYEIDLARKGGHRKSTVTPFGAASEQAAAAADAEK